MENFEDMGGAAQAVALIQETSSYSKRDALLTLDDGRRFLYNDKEKTYEPIERFVKLAGEVSTVESFAELVVEYAKRSTRAAGEKQTVTFTSAGATYSPDDDDRRHLFTYKRVLSQQWLALKAVLGKPMSHKDLIRALQTLSPSIVDYPLVMASFRRLVVSKDVKLVSEPTLNETGDSANGYNVHLSLKGGTTETTLPSSITLRLQYARGGDATYDVPVEVDLTAKDDVPVVTLFAPLIDAIADQAVMDEMKAFDEAMDRTGLKELLVVVNF